MKQINFFDTTLRDGEQSPGASMTPDDKVKIAIQLEKMNVDIIEAGFAVSSPAQMEAIQRICDAVRKPTIASLARSVENDIKVAGEALKNADHFRIHTFIATSPIHRKHKLNLSKEEVVKRAVAAVQYAKTFTHDVEWSAEDASRTEPDFLSEIVEAVINAGATTVNIPDTVGYTTPSEFREIIGTLKQNVPNISQADISIHCHNDLGLAVANTLAAVEAGATQVEVAVNGIGERAGNASLEEVVMALNTRQDFYQVEHHINTKEIYKTSKLIVAITGLPIQPNKAIVGKNAFAHEAGIHQDGVLKERSTYEIMTPEQIGRPSSEIVLGRHSGKHGLKARLKALGYELNDLEFEKVFKRFTEVADKKKAVYDDELVVILEENTGVQIPSTYSMESIQIMSGISTIPTATVSMKRGDQQFIEAATGNGPVDAIYSIIDKIVGIETVLEDYTISSISTGEDAMGEVSVTLRYQDRAFSGHASSTDILLASAKAYLNAMNRILYDQQRSSQS